MNPSEPKVPNLWQYLDEFQSTIAGVHGSLPASRDKAMLGELLQELQKARIEAQQIVPEALKELQKKNEELKAWTERFPAELEQQKAELDAAFQAAETAASAMPPETPAMPGLGVPLSQEVLRRFGSPAAKKKDGKQVDEGSVAQHWHEAEEGQAAPRPVPSPIHPPTPPATSPSKIIKIAKKRKPSSDSDAWEGLSQAEE